jgi:flagellar motor switch protein FliM
MSTNEKVIRKKIRKTIAKAEAYPLIEVIINNLQGRISQRLRHIFGQSVEGMVEDKGIQRFADYFDTLMFPAILCLFESDKLSGRGLVFMEGRFMEDLIEMLLGFPNNKEQVREARSPTSIDKALIMRTVKECLNELTICLQKASGAIGEINFNPIAVESTPQMAVITAERTPCYVAKIHFDIGEVGYGGRLDIVIPIPMLAPIRKFLTQSFRGDVQGDEASWKQSITYAVSKTRFTMQAELERLQMTVAEINRLEVGSVIPLNAHSSPTVELVYDDGREREVLAEGRLGTWKSMKAVKLTSENFKPFMKDFEEAMFDADLIERNSDRAFDRPEELKKAASGAGKR